MISFRNKVLHASYTGILKPIFFKRNPEDVHDHMTKVGVFLGRYGVTKGITRAFFGYSHPLLEQDVLGIHFKNPIGLSAGFDKNAELTDILPSVGFGFVEVGSITGEKCLGNPKPRLWRLKDSKSLAVYYGLKNDGAEVISARLAGKTFDIPIGVSVAMTNCMENTDIPSAVKDFAKAFRIMEKQASYITVNISCPNTHGGQPFIIPSNLESLLSVLDAIPTTKPIFVKLSPDMAGGDINSLLDVIHRHRVQGIVCTNLTKKRDNPKIQDADVPTVGGLSGKVVEDLSDKLLSHIYKREGKKYVLIGSGGVFSAEDAYRKIRLGATLIQLITGMIFEGPQLISEINRGLAKLLERDGFKNVGEAVGVDVE